jgi:two-component system NtrC family sensor kinase
MTCSVLIVDDSLTVRMHLAEAFSEAGFCVFPCGTFAEATEILRREPIDVAILDVVLPDGNGVELLAALRAVTLDRHVVVLMLTTEVEVRDRLHALRAGADEYVGKPYDIGYVIARTLELLRLGRAACVAPGTVLLIEGSLSLRAVLSQALGSVGYRVSVAESAEEGLRLAQLQRPQAMIVASELPGMDGAALIRHVRLDAGLRRVACLLLTGSGQNDAELRALDSGADASVDRSEDVTIILAKLQAVLRMAPDTSPDVEERLLSPSRILAVDDSMTYREILGAALRGEGYDVILVSSGEEALEVLAIQAVDCVLLDLVMPGIGGTETCRRIKASPMTRDIPVVVLTARDDRASMLESLATGADDYIQKSGELDVLKARVRAQLRRRQFEDETRRVRERLLRSEIESAEARRAREVTEVRAALVEVLETKNQELAGAMQALQSTQAQLVQAAKMASLGELVAGIAHEINNPLAFSLSHLVTATKSLARAESELRPEQSELGREHWARAQDRLREMSLGLERIRELVVKLRTFSHIDEGEWRQVNMRECIESVLTILGHRLRDRIIVETSFGEPSIIECYPGLLNQAVMNLIANSIDAIQDTGTIQIKTGSVGADYQISITDSGPGIPVSVRDRVFEPFFTTKAVGEGTGLGLSITYSIVKKHGGQLLLDCPELGGTNLTISIPLVAPAQPLGN